MQRVIGSISDKILVLFFKQTDQRIRDENTLWISNGQVCTVCSIYDSWFHLCIDVPEKCRKIECHCTIYTLWLVSSILFKNELFSNSDESNLMNLTLFDWVDCCPRGPTGTYFENRWLWIIMSSIVIINWKIYRCDIWCIRNMLIYEHLEEVVKKCHSRLKNKWHWSMEFQLWKSNFPKYLTNEESYHSIPFGGIVIINSTLLDCS